MGPSGDCQSAMKSYLSKNGIAVIGHHDASHWVQKHLGQKQKLYLSVPDKRKRICGRKVSIRDQPTFIMDLGPKHVRMISAIVYGKKCKTRKHRPGDGVSVCQAKGHE